jgi:hypothetical protein
VSIAVEAIEILVVAIDVNGCECSFVRGDRRVVDGFSTNDLWS